MTTMPRPTATPTHTVPASADDARMIWKKRHRDTSNADALTDWSTTTAADGRLLHTARVTCPNPAHVLHQFVQNHRMDTVWGDQQMPVLDYSVPGRLGCLWLLNGEWIELWAPDRQTRPVPKPYPMGVTPAIADQLLAATLTARTPSGRLHFTRRPKTHKETAA